MLALSPVAISRRCADGRHTLLVVPFLLGQFRIQITDLEQPDRHAPEGHGSIVRELCTYQIDRLSEVLDELEAAADPLAQACTYERPWNCKYAGDRIRLDNEPGPEFSRDMRNCAETQTDRNA